ncbi:vitamin D-binding protein [Centroberyx gerrardi]
MLRAALCLLLLQSVAAQNEICNVYKTLKDEGFKAMFLVALAQNLRNSSQAELAPGLDEAHAMATMCCSAAATADCGREVKHALQALVRSRETQMRSICLVRRHNTDTTVRHKMLVEFSQKFPQVPVELIRPIVEGFMPTTASCCQRDMATCMRLTKQSINTMCNNKNVMALTTGIAECCKLDMFRNINCLSSMKPDPKPEGLSQRYDLPGDTQAVCRTYAESPEKAVTNVLYEVSRRHPEVSQAVILRYVAAAQQAVAKCCANNDPAECIKTAMADNDLEKAIADHIACYKNIAAFKATMGNPGFEKSLLIRYTRTMPQASFDLVHHTSKVMADIYAECLETDNDHELLACEDMVINAISEHCLIYGAASNDSKIPACCNQTYTERVQCFLSMEPDTDFQPPEFDAKNFQLGVKLCTNTAEEQLTFEKRLLYVLVSYKTTITGKQITKISDTFKAMKAKCCAEADKAACFNTEASLLKTGVTELLKSRDSA